MTLLMVEGFDHWTTSAQAGLKWTSLNFGNAFINTGRFSTNGFDFGVNNQSFLSKTFGSTYATGIAGSAYKFNNTGTISLLFSFHDGTTGTNQMTLFMNTSNKLEVRRNGTIVATGTTILSSGVFYYIEFKTTIHPSAGTIDVRINGVSEISLTGQNTRASANSFWNIFQLCGPSGGSSFLSQIFDDVYVCNDSGSTNNNFLGDVRIQTIFPTGAGATTGFTPSTGSNWQNVDEASPNGDTDYNAAALAGTTDTFTMGNLSSSAGTVYGIQYNIYNRKDDAGSKTIAPVTRFGGVDYAGTTTSVFDSYTYDREVVETNPGTSAAFTIADINTNNEFGYKVVA